MLRRICMVSALAVGLLVCAVASGQDYVIKVTRASKVGDQFGLVVSGEETSVSQMSNEKQVLEKNSVTMKATLEADAKVLAVDEKGRPTSSAYTVRKWEGSINDKPVTEVEKGSVMQVKVEGAKGSIRGKDGEFPEEVKGLLQKILPNATAGQQVADDGVFGTSERKSVGDEWPVNAGVTAKGLSRTGVQVEEKDVTGSVQLEKVVKVGDVPCLHIGGTFRIIKFTIPLPEGAKPLKSNFEASFSGDYPVDTSMSKLSESFTFNMSLEAELPKGAVKLTMSNKTALTLTRNYTPIK